MSAGRRRRIEAHEAAIGDTVRIILDVPVREYGASRAVQIGGSTVSLGDLVRAHAIFLRPPSAWKPGDVIVIRFDTFRDSKAYTYVRGSKDWPGETQSLTDAQVDAAIRDGRAKHVLRDGEPVTKPEPVTPPRPGGSPFGGPTLLRPRPTSRVPGRHL